MTSVVLDRLVDILLVQVLRAHLASAPVTRPSWLGVLSDDVAGAAAARLHQEPSRPWTTAALARAAGVSRATLTRRFTTATGQSPGAYLTRWRMDLAARRLRDTDDSLEAIARSVGYTSVHAFSRAFSRLRAPRPGSTAPPPAKSRGDANPRSGPGRRILKPAFGKRAALFRSRPGAEVHLREANAKAARSALQYV